MAGAPRSTVTTEEIGKTVRVSLTCRHEAMTIDLLPKQVQDDRETAVEEVTAIMVGLHQRKYPEDNGCIKGLPSSDQTSQATFAKSKVLSGDMILILVLGKITISVEGDPTNLDSFRAVIGCDHITGELYYGARSRRDDQTVSPKKTWKGVLDCAQLLRKRTKCTCIQIPILEKVRDDLTRRLEIRGFSVSPS